jgi:hypothetical protein
LTSQLRDISNPKKSKSKKTKSGRASTSKGGIFNDLMDVDVEKKSLKRPRGGKQREDEGLSNDQKAFLSSSIELLSETDMNQLIDLLRESGAPLQVLSFYNVIHVFHVIMHVKLCKYHHQSYLFEIERWW